MSKQWAPDSWPKRQMAFLAAWLRSNSELKRASLLPFFIIPFYYSCLKSVTVIHYSKIDKFIFPQAVATSFTKWHYSIITTTTNHVIIMPLFLSTAQDCWRHDWFFINIVLTTDFLDLFTSWNTITYLIYRAKYLNDLRRTNNLHVVINQSLTGTSCMRVWRVIIAVRIKGGRGSNVQWWRPISPWNSLAIIFDSCFPL